jgi:hypothetical protein
VESRIDMNGTLIEENRVTDDTDGQPIYELDKYGSDLSDHYGIKWIYLLCPHC